jgi:hypothetical protein
MAYRTALKSLCVGLSCVGLILPTSVLEAAPPLAVPVRRDVRGHAPLPSQRLAGDVSLDSAGYLHGLVVDGHGVPVADQAVVLGQTGRQFAHVRTGAAGRFRVGPVRGGTYLLSSGGHGRLVRAWAPHTAPPAAAKTVLVVAGDEVVRGQMPLEEFFASDAVIVCGLVAAMIAVPIAVSTSKSKPRSP